MWVIETGEGLGVEEGLVQNREARRYHDGGRIICRERREHLDCRDELGSGQRGHEMSKKMEALMVREGWDRTTRTGLLMSQRWF